MGFILGFSEGPSLGFSLGLSLGFSMGILWVIVKGSLRLLV